MTWPALSISPCCAETIDYVRANGCPTEILYSSDDDDDDDESSGG
jgi:hypothetical protein